MDSGQPPVTADGIVAHKVLNNNVVITIDGHGRERVLMGRGLGFGLRATDVVDTEKVEKTFILAGGDDGDRERQLLADVPYPIIDAVTNAVDRAERTLGHRLDRRFTMAVIDHVQFLLERVDQGIRIPVANMPELRVLYPREFEAAQLMSQELSSALAQKLPGEEAVFLTMHLLNATRDEPDGTSALLLRRLHHVLDTVETGLGAQLDMDSPGYARFVLHIQFLLQRLGSETMLRSADSSFFEFAKHSYGRSFAIAEAVAAYLRAATSKELTDEEMLYLIVHIERLAAGLHETV